MANKIREESRVLRTLVDDLIDLFGWEDTSPTHALMHVKNAVLNERAGAATNVTDLEMRLSAANLLITAAKAEASLARGELAAAQAKLHDIAKRRTALGIQTIELPPHAGEGSNL